MVTREQIERWRSVAESDAGHDGIHVNAPLFRDMCDLALRAFDQADDARLGAKVRAELDDMSWHDAKVIALEACAPETYTRVVFEAIAEALREESKR